MSSLRLLSLFALFVAALPGCFDEEPSPGATPTPSPTSSPTPSPSAAPSPDGGGAPQQDGGDGAPSFGYSYVGVLDDRIALGARFDRSQPFKVFLAGQELSPMMDADDPYGLYVAASPSAQPYSGDLWAIVSGQKTNVLHVTEWHCVVDVTEVMPRGNGQVTATVHANVRFRQIVDAFDESGNVVADDFAFGQSDGTVSYHATGSWSDVDGSWTLASDPAAGADLPLPGNLQFSGAVHRQGHDTHTFFGVQYQRDAADVYSLNGVEDYREHAVMESPSWPSHLSYFPATMDASGVMRASVHDLKDAGGNVFTAEIAATPVATTLPPGFVGSAPDKAE
jgi:hypothetical protein